MDEFTMSAFARYSDGSSGDAFAEVSSHSLVACFGAMAAEVAEWLPRALSGGEDPGRPLTIELTLEWGGAPTRGPAPDGPVAPSGRAGRRPSPPRCILHCVARHRSGPTAPAPALSPCSASLSEGRRDGPGDGGYPAGGRRAG